MSNQYNSKMHVIKGTVTSRQRHNQHVKRSYVGPKKFRRYKHFTTKYIIEIHKKKINEYKPQRNDITLRVLVATTPPSMETDSV